MRTTTLPKLLIASESAQFEDVIQTFLNEHPEFSNSVYKIYPEAGKSLSIEQIRHIKKELLIAATEKLIIIYDFQTAKAEAQNALLKTLEDQTHYTQFILCTNQIGTVLPTIISRCQIVDLIAQETFIVDDQILASIDELFESSSYSFLNDKNFQAANIDEAKIILHKILVALQRKVHQGDTIATAAAQEALNIFALLKTNNLNPQLAIDTWCLFVKRNALKKG